MGGEKKRSRRWWTLATAAAWLLLVLVVYVSAYHALVVRAKAQSRSGVVVVIPVYRTEWMEVLFRPIHEIDREWIRPQAWEP